MQLNIVQTNYRNEVSVDDAFKLLKDFRTILTCLASRKPAGEADVAFIQHMGEISKHYDSVFEKANFDSDI